MTTTPLEHFCVLQEINFLELLGWKGRWPQIPVKLQLNMNLHTPLKIDPRAFLVIDTREEGAPPSCPGLCYSMTNIKRWRLDISAYKTFDDYVKGMIRWHRCNYNKSKKTFFEYGCTTTYHEGDWSEYAERAEGLYANVARQFQHRMFDLSFFREVAKNPAYKLLCGWYKDEMIAAFVMEAEETTLHNLCCGLDYKHSSASYAYSYMHHVLFEHAIDAQKYQTVDVGFTADEAKKSIGFKPVVSRMDFYTNNVFLRKFLQTFSRVCSATLNAEGKLRLGRPRSQQADSTA